MCIVVWGTIVSWEQKAYLLIVAWKLPKVAFCWKFTTVFSLEAWRGGPDKFMPSQTKFWGGTPGQKVSWVRQVCVLSDKACSKVQSGLVVLRKVFRSWFFKQKIAPRPGTRLFPGHVQPSFGRWLGNARRVPPPPFPTDFSSVSSGGVLQSSE